MEALFVLTYFICIGMYLDGDTPMKVDTGIVTSKGQLVVPARLRRRFGIKRGTVIAFIEENGHMLLQPVTREFIRGLRGSLKGEVSALNVLLEERQREHTL
jgi:AbrB family looped-hinge helix DNA binding protein